MQHFDVQLNESGTAWLDCYLQEPNLGHGRIKTRPAIVIAPGGGYLHLAEREGGPVAMRFLGLGYDTFVLHYPVLVLSNIDDPGEPRLDPQAIYPVQIVAAMRAMAWVRAHAAEYEIDASRVYVLGFSAGAHVMGTLSQRFDDEELLAQAGTTAEVAKPSGSILCYPMVSAGLHAWEEEGFVSNLAGAGPLISRAVFDTIQPSASELESVDLRLHVRPDQPRTFIWQTSEDATVPPFETLDLAAALQRAGVPCELHLFQQGPHGVSLADRTTAATEEQILVAAAWTELAARWLAIDDPTELVRAER
jgi:acetyl esterase/lipase